jgi:hypothetical protein
MATGLYNKLRCIGVLLQVENIVASFTLDSESGIIEATSAQRQSGAGSSARVATYLRHRRSSALQVDFPIYAASKCGAEA